MNKFAIYIFLILIVFIALLQFYKMGFDKSLIYYEQKENELKQKHAEEIIKFMNKYNQRISNSSKSN